LLLLPFWFWFSFPPSLAVPASCYTPSGFSHVQYSLTLLSSLGSRGMHATRLCVFLWIEGKVCCSCWGRFWEEKGHLLSSSQLSYSLFTQESLHAGGLVGFSWGQRGSIAAMAAAISGERKSHPFSLFAFIAPISVMRCLGTRPRLFLSLF
jgi:hypothetical protein